MMEITIKLLQDNVLATIKSQDSKQIQFFNQLQ